jgi:hypothetical protein
LAIDLIAYQTDKFIERDDDWLEEYEYYQTSLIYAAEMLDRTYMTYAAVFNEDLEHISGPPSNADSQFDPLNYSKFVNTVFLEERGEIDLPYAGIDEPERIVKLYYRWIPTAPGFNNRFLIAVGISKFAIEARKADWTISGYISLIAITTILNIAMIAFICQQVEKKDYLGGG